jgi:hypothetical protein
VVFRRPFSQITRSYRLDSIKAVWHALLAKAGLLVGAGTQGVSGGQTLMWLRRDSGFSFLAMLYSIA